MSAIQFGPCGDVLVPELAIKTLLSKPFEIVISQTAQSAFVQINDQLRTRPVSCPICDRHVEAIVQNSLALQRFPLSERIFSRINISPLNVELRDAVSTANKVSNVIHFTKVEESNIINEGRNSSDHGKTNQRLAELANDFNGLVSSLGGVVGRILYWLPTSFKASKFIGSMREARAKGIAHASWVLSDKNDQTIGLVSLTKIENEKFNLDGELINKKLYNIGVMLHSNFQRKGVVTELTRHLFEQFCRLNLDMDGLWIFTRPDNAAVNHIARKLNFTFIKTMDVRHENLIPFFTTYIPSNLYMKSISSNTEGSPGTSEKFKRTGNFPSV